MKSRNLFLILIVFCIFVFLEPTSLYGQEFTISKSDLKLSVGGNDNIEVTSDNRLNLDSVSWSGQGDFLEVEKTLTDDGVRLNFTALKATPSKTLTLRVGSQDKSITFTISPTLNFNELVFSSSTPSNELVNSSSINIGTTRPLFQDQPYVVRIRKTDNSIISDDLIIPRVEPENAALVDFKNGQLTITGKVPQKGVIIRFESEGIVVPKTLSFDIQEGTGEIIADSINLFQNEEKELSSAGVRIMGKEGTNALPLSDAKCEIDNSEIASVTNCEKIVAGKSVGRGNLTIKSGAKTKTVAINVLQKSSRVIVKAPPDSKLQISYPNKSLTLGAQILDADDKPMDDQAQELDWKILSGVGSEGGTHIRVNVDRRTNTASFLANDKVSENMTAKIQVCLKSEIFKFDPQKCAEIIASIHKQFEITGFRPLKIRLDMMDEQTAKDLFGKKAIDEYFIAKIRLFNTIRKDDSEFGNSILVYSESLEVKVGVEWRQRKAEKPVIDKNGVVHVLQDTDWQTLDVARAQDWFPDGITVHPDPKDPVFKNCHVISQANMFVPYRPLTYEMVTNTQERRDDRSLRSKVLFTMNGLASLSSFVTAIAIPGANSDLPAGLDKFKNLLIPSFEKLFPSRNEVQRQNITSMVMRPLEEIPFGSDITRILFFPKRSIRGVLTNRLGAKDTELRISAISIADACAEAGVIKKLTENAPIP